MSGKAVWGPRSVRRWGLVPLTPRMISCFVFSLGIVGLTMGVRATEALAARGRLIEIALSCTTEW